MNYQHLFRYSGTFFLSLLLSLFCFAQNTTVRGVLKDPNGLPLQGASVTVEGTRNGTTTDVNGAFSLNVPPGNYTLILSFVGYQTQRQQVTVPAGGLSNLSYNLASGGDLNRIVVVGSRSTTVRSSTQTAVPVDVVSARDLQATGQIEPTQMLNFVVPSYNSSRQTIADGTDHIDPATVRGLGPDQVLVLVNGRRRYNQALLNVNGTIGRGSVGTDMNSIVPSAIERVEVLRDGASSQYGSDAIAGVVNVVMKKNNRGTSVYGHIGQQYAGDGAMRQVGITQGFKLGKEGYLTISGDLRHRGFTNRAGKYLGRVYVNDAAQDSALIAQNGFSRFNNMYIGNSEVSNKGVIVNAGIPLSSRLQFFLTAGLNHRNGEAFGFYRYPRQTTQVIADLYPNGFLPQIASTIKDRSVIAGVEGKLGAGWNWDLSQASGSNSFRFDIANTNNASQFALGRNAPTQFYAGTLKFSQHTTNLNFAKDFGKQMGFQTFNVAFGGELRFDRYQIEAGEEGSWKNFDPSSGRVGGAQVFPGFQPSNAVNETRRVVAGYVDLESDITSRFLVNAAGRFENYSDFGSNIAGKLALRYKLFDAFSLRAAVSNGFRAPSLHQRYFSAISTVFVQTQTGLQPFQQGTFRNNSEVAAAFGIPKLDAETSMNYSVGFTSRMLKNRLSLTVDGYQIDIKNRIVLTSSLRRFSAPEANAVNTILNQFPALNDVSSVIFFLNAIQTRTRGIDIVSSYTARMGKADVTLTLAGNFNETLVIGNPKTGSVTDSALKARFFGRDEKGRYEWAQPQNKFTLGMNYRINRFNFNTRVTRFGAVRTLDPNNPLLDEYFSPKYVTDASLSYRIGNFLTWTVGANNIGDVYPDRLRNFANTSSGVFVYSRNATQFGFNGGYYYTSIILDAHNIKFKKAPKKVTATVPPPMMETDSDGDGVADSRDACPNAAGPAALNGCPDGDGDGVADKDDQCPTVAGAKIFAGCPDTDGDGIQDSKDKCPQQAGLAQYEGCPAPDTDGDGVKDNEDRCPTVAGDPANGGCPKEVAKEVQQRVDKVAKEILFETNSDRLKASSGPALDAIAEELKNDSNIQVEIEGHTDNVGSNASNQTLSEKRAASVKRAFIRRGVDESRIMATGFGEEQPMADNGTAAGRAKNRRVVVRLKY